MTTSAVPKYHKDAIAAWSDATPGGRSALRKKIAESAEFCDMIAASSADYATSDPNNEIGSKAVYEHWTGEAAMLRRWLAPKEQGVLL